MRIAIVTGASSGIGREFVRQIPMMYRSLDEIWVIARREERLNEIQKEDDPDVRIRVICGNLTTEATYEKIGRMLEEEKPQIRMLVNAAGYGKTGDFADCSVMGQIGMIDLNCKALTWMTGICLPYLSQGSRIIQLASAAAFAPEPGFAVYAASKAYVYSFSLALRSELKSKGIVVTAVCPGPVDTEFFDHVKDNGEKESSAEEDSQDLFFERSGKDLLWTNAQDVVRRALIDSCHKKAVSVNTASMKGTRFAAKLMPYSFVAEIMKAVNASKERDD